MLLIVYVDRLCMYVMYCILKCKFYCFIYIIAYCYHDVDYCTNSL